MSQTHFDSLAAHGFCFLPQFLPGLSLDKAINNVCSAQNLTCNRDAEALRPTTQVFKNRITYSSIYGLNAFPLHTDGAYLKKPPAFIMLRCVRGYPNVSTTLLDSRFLISEFGMARLSRSLLRPLHSHSNAEQLVRILDFESDSTLFRWDQVFLRPASRVAQSVYQDMKTYIAAQNPASITLCDKGDTLLIDNRRVLHGRSGVNEHNTDRLIDRVYLEQAH